MNTVCIKYRQSAKSQKPWMENVSLATSAGCHDLAVAFKKDGYGFVRNKLQLVSYVSIPQGGIGNSVPGSHGWRCGNRGGVLKCAA